MCAANGPVLHVIENLREAHGGPTFAAIGLALHQSAMGTPVSILCREGPSTEQMRDRLRGGSGQPPVPVIELPQPTSGGVASILERIGPRIIHVHGIWDPMIRATIRAARPLGIPWVVTSHGMLHPDALAKRRIAKWAYLRFGCRVIRGARHVMALNREERAFVAARLHPSCSIVPAGVEVSEALPEPSGDFRRSVPELGDRPFVMFLGRIDPIKGIDRLLHAFAIASKMGLAMDLVVAGPEFGAGDAVRALVRELGLSGRVHLTGPLWDRRKQDALAECTIFAHRPRYEGYGLAVVEAMAAGRPVVTTAACRVDEARDAGAVMVARDEDLAFAEALVHLASRPVEARELGRRAHAWVLAHGGWPAIERRVDAVYRGALSDSAPGHARR